MDCGRQTSEVSYVLFLGFAAVTILSAFTFYLATLLDIKLVFKKYFFLLLVSVVSTQSICQNYCKINRTLGWHFMWKG